MRQHCKDSNGQWKVKVKDRQWKGRWQVKVKDRPWEGQWKGQGKVKERK